MRMIAYNIKHRKLDHIFISHLHGDHFFGLIGLLSTYHLIGRQSSIHLSAPRALQSLIKHHFETTGTTLSFPLIFNALEDFSESNLYEDDYLFVKAFPIIHSTPTWGFLIKEKEKKRGIDRSFVEKYQPDVKEIIEIRKGKDYLTKNGILLPNNSITKKPAPVRSYAYCSDTAYEPAIAPIIEGVNLLYHEATFDNSMQDKAHNWLHSTAAEAAMIAKKAGAKKLLIGHFSNRHHNFQLLLDEAKEVFENTLICKEGQTYRID
jgi:ribonuclease Z